MKKHYQRHLLIFTALFLLIEAVYGQTFRTGLEVTDTMRVLAGNSYTGGGKKMFWIPARAAFRAGELSSGSTRWDAANMGYGSFAGGMDNRAKGLNSTAFGFSNSADGNQSFAVGFNNQATGFQAVSMGTSNESAGNSTIAMGSNNLAQGIGSIAMGYDSQTQLNYSVAMGYKAQTKYEKAVAIGTEANATGVSSVAIGTRPNGIGESSVAIGTDCSAIGVRSMALGVETRAEGDYSTAMGRNTVATGENSTATGAANYSEGVNSFSAGLASIARGNQSAVIGRGLINRVHAATVIGYYNDTLSTNATSYNSDISTDPVFIIGNGTSTDRNNALFVRKDGRMAIGLTSNNPTELLDINGSARFRAVSSGAFFSNLNLTSNGTLTTSTSDARLKQNIRTIDNALDKVGRLRGVNFTWKDDKTHQLRIGLVAQEVKEVVPELVFQNPTDGYYGVQYADAVGLLVEAIKELKSENEDLKNRLLRIENMLEHNTSAEAKTRRE